MSMRQEEFGFCDNEQYRLRSEKREGADEEQHEVDVEEEAPLLTLFSVYISFLVVICVGHVRDFFGQRFRKSHHSHLMANKVRSILPACLGACNADPVLGLRSTEQWFRIFLRP